MLTPKSSITTAGDLGGQKVKMRIDENALAHIMSVLTDLYSDPQMAVIREYSTNARDSHIEAGNTDPIQIVTPTGLSPYFKIIDHGIGLSVDDITNMYSLYGASTKRDTNEQTGMLGLGAKSALTLVPQFNLTCVKNGVETFVSVSRAADGSGQMEIIDTRSTDKPNGVEVSIPIPTNTTFSQKVKDFFKFWPRGSVLVDGQEPKHIDGLWITDDVVIDRTLAQDYIVMGNVAYPVKEGLWHGNYYYNHLGIVAFVEIGEINFTPSREQLHYTPATKATIAQIKGRVANNLLIAANKAIDVASNHAEAWEIATKWRRDFSTGDLRNLTYNKIQVPGDIALTAILDTSKHKHRVVDIFATRGSRSWSNLYSLNPEVINKHMFITGFNASLKMSPVQRERVAKYAEQQGWSINRVVITSADKLISPLSPWLENIKIAKWEDVAKIKIDRAQTTRVVRTDPYDLFTGSWSYTSVSALDTTKDIIYISPAENKQPSFLKRLFPDAQIVMLGMNRWEKFKRDYPTAEHYSDKLNNVKNKLISELTDDDTYLWHYFTDWHYYFQNWDASKVNDPELRRFAELMQTKTAWSPAATRLRAMGNDAGTRDVPRPANPLSKYPLAGRMNSVALDHTYWYINTYYSTLEKEN
jgi:hypothetical protein